MVIQLFQWNNALALVQCTGLELWLSYLWNSLLIILAVWKKYGLHYFWEMRTVWTGVIKGKDMLKNAIYQSVAPLVKGTIYFLSKFDSGAAGMRQEENNNGTSCLITLSCLTTSHRNPQLVSGIQTVTTSTVSRQTKQKNYLRTVWESNKKVFVCLSSLLLVGLHNLDQW